MNREIDADFNQALMFPPVVEQWIGNDHPARFVRDLVDSLDLEALGFYVRASEVGRPNYSVRLLLRVWLYGYFSGVRSTRKLERACLNDMGLIWLTGMNAPDHNTLWRFWLVNKKALRNIFKQSVKIALNADLVGFVVHALDGTKIMARSSKEGIWNRHNLEKALNKIDESIKEIMSQVETAQRKEQGEYRLPEELKDSLKRKEVIQASIIKLDEIERNHFHPSEPEARMMKNTRSIELSYNAQAVADQKSGMIVAQDVVSDETDMDQLVPMLDRVQENLGKVSQETLADGGYNSTIQLGLAEQRGYEVLTNGRKKELTADVEWPYHSSRFIYDQQRNCCVCPEGNILTYERTKATKSLRYQVKAYRCKSFRNCVFRERCTKDPRGRMVEITPYHTAIIRQREKRRDPNKIKLLKARKVIVEPVFAWIKERLDFRRWTLCGLENVKAQWALICSTINFKKLYQYWLDQRLILTK